MQTQARIGDTVEFTHPTRDHKVVGTLVSIVDNRFYVVDDGQTRPTHHLAIQFAEMFKFRVVPSGQSHAE